MKYFDDGIRSDNQGNEAKYAIMTTIMPRNIELQQQAIRSWVELGFKVLSMNAREELIQIQHLFPEIEFIQAKRDAREIFGKPYIFFDDILDYFQHHEYEICGIVNSDIILDNPRLKEAICKEAVGSMVYGSRLDIESLDQSNRGVFYDVGFDYFFFDKEVINIFPQEDYCLGIPWWDWWAVLLPIAKGIKVKRILNVFAYHFKHDQRWNREAWTTYGNITLKYFPEFETAEITPSIAFKLHRKIIDCSIPVFFMEPKEVNQKVLLIYNHPGTEIEDSLTYQSIVNQNYPNYRVVSSETVSEPGDIPEDYVCVVEDGQILNANFLNIMLSSIGDKEFITCNLRINRINGNWKRLDPSNYFNVSVKETLFSACTLYTRKYFLEKEDDSFDFIHSQNFSHLQVELVEYQLQDYVAGLLKDKQGKKIYIYGAGGHTEYLLKNIRNSSDIFSGIFDKNNGLKGKSLLGLTIMPVEEINQTEFDYLLISSQSYEKEIYKELIETVNEEKLIRIYNY